MRTTGPTYEEVEGYLKYYAYRFDSNRFQADELINVAWMGIRNQTNPKYWSAGIRWAMQNYIKKELSRDSWGTSATIVVVSMDQEVDDGYAIKDLIGCVDNSQLLVDDKEILLQLIHKCKLKVKHKTMLYQYYFLGMNQEEIGKLHGNTRQNVSTVLQRVLKKLKDVA